MIKVQKQDFNIEKEITKLKNKYSNVGAINTFIGYVRDLNNNLSLINGNQLMVLMFDYILKRKIT